MTILVTGASGFIGSALVQRLVSTGYHVKALLHQKPPSSLDCQVRYIVGDLTDPASLTSAMSDVEVVFHCAARVSDYGPKKEIETINFKGTKNLIDACRHRIKRFIFLSHLPETSIRPSGAYSASKAHAERYLLNQYHQEKFPVILIRPGNVYGPGATTWVLRPLQAIQQNRLRLINKGSGIFLHTYIDNLIDALIPTIHAPDIIGETIEITDGDNTLTWGTYLNDLAAIAGKPPIQKSMSGPTALLLSKLFMLRYILSGRPPLVTPTAVRLFTNTRTVSLQKAHQLLNYTPAISYDEGMRRTKSWLQKQRLI